MKSRDIARRAGDDAESKAHNARDSKALELLARAGLVAYGVVYLLLGWLAIQLAVGGKDENADASGALRTLAEQPFGQLLLWLVTGGLVALALWQAVEAAVGHQSRSGGDRAKSRLKSGARAVVYAALAFSAGRIASGAGVSNARSQQKATSDALSLPGGQFLVATGGAAVIALGLYQIVKGVKKTFMEEFDTSEVSPATREAVTRLGQWGYLAKGVSFVIVGGLLGLAAITYDPDKSQGLDGALETLRAQPFGAAILVAIGAGFAAFGLFAVLQSRYRPM